MIDIALRAPARCCVVPENRTEVTTEGGLDVVGKRTAAALRPNSSARESRLDVHRAFRTRPPCEPAWARRRSNCTRGRGATRARGTIRPRPVRRLTAASRPPPPKPPGSGLKCHAGHGLDYDAARLIAALPEIVELNIGHFLIGEAIFVGLAETIRTMRAAMKEGRAAREGRR